MLMLITDSELEQSLYTLEMCVATLMEKAQASPMDPDHNFVYAELLSATNKMRGELGVRGVELVPPMYTLSSDVVLSA